MLALWLCQPCSDLDFKGVGKKKEMHDGIFREKYLIKWELKCWFSTNQALAEMGESSSERWTKQATFFKQDLHPVVLHKRKSQVFWSNFGSRPLQLPGRLHYYSTRILALK